MSGLREIDYQFKQAINGTGHFFLIDEPSIVDEMSGFTIFYRGFCDSVPGVFAEFETSNFSEETLLECLNTKLVSASSESGYDSLYELMDRHNQGLISIKAGRNLEIETVELLAGLLDYARQNKLAWKVFLVADTLNMDDMALAQFGVDQSIPDESIHLDAVAINKPVRNKKQSASAYRKSRSKNFLPSKLQYQLKSSLLTRSTKILAAAVVLIVIGAVSVNGL